MPNAQRLATALRTGRIAAGPFLNLNSPALAEMLGHAGFDFVVVDAQHTAFSMETVEGLVRAADGVGLSSLVRVPGTDPVTILKALDLGAGGVLVAHVDTAEDARRAVQAAKFPPLGERGACPSVRAAGFQSRDWREYQTRANDETLLIVLVESIEAVRNAGEILACDGVDAFLAGAYDLSCTLGFPGEYRHPQVIEAVETFLAAARAAGRPVGVHLFDPADAAFWVERGARFFTLSLTSLIHRAVRAAAEEVGQAGQVGMERGRSR